MNDDTPTGFDRYTAGGTERETIDEMRDLAYQQAVRLVGDKHDGIVDGVTPDDLADELFAFHCDATALKYERREGRKGPAAEDAAKAKWYRAMAAHARGEGPDPRAGRPDFKPYQRPETT